MRACQRKSLGLDSTLAGHIVVVMMEVIEPFLAGCISPYNQVHIILFIFDTSLQFYDVGTILNRVNRRDYPNT